MTGRIIALLIVLGVADSIAVWRIDWTKDLYAGSLLLAFAVFVVALRMQNKKYSSGFATLFKTSANVYLIHIMVGEVLAMAMGDVQFYLYLKPLIIFALSVGIALIIGRISTSRK